MKKSNIKVTKKRKLYCAYKCVDCGATEVEPKTISATNRQPFVDKEASRKIADELAERKLDKTVGRVRKQVNKLHHFEYIYRFDGSCRECGTKQPWAKKNLLLKACVFLIILALWFLYAFLSPKWIWQIPFVFVTIGAPIVLWIVALWVIHLTDKVRICKLLDEKKDPACYPFISDGKNLKLPSDDLRVQAIATVMKKSRDEKSVMTVGTVPAVPAAPEPETAESAAEAPAK